MIKQTDNSWQENFNLRYFHSTWLLSSWFFQPLFSQYYAKFVSRSQLDTEVSIKLIFQTTSLDNRRPNLIRISEDYKDYLDGPVTNDQIERICKVFRYELQIIPYVKYDKLDPSESDYWIIF